ncbi:WhiB family transcriptional regulator [uncultured Varibaculum sp.]|uniref:WhiB family transcriptional regulator n=1 Tax=uncultured Varibaculum sp. TaxID=413896 RepID=UPI00288A703C|nr:WhiB family transcriptional regulator [uncultured Varibaculum sp.]
MHEKDLKYYRGIRQPWMEFASCLGLSFAFDKSAWGKGSNAIKYRRVCKRVCNRCPVKTQCLKWALDMEKDRAPVFQVAGGLTRRERLSLAD